MTRFDAKPPWPMRAGPGVVGLVDVGDYDSSSLAGKKVTDHLARYLAQFSSLSRGTFKQKGRNQTGT